MLFGRKDLLDKIRLGEDSYLELKELKTAGGKIRGPSQNDLADELAAFANSRGGILVIGVDDKTRSILGVPHEFLDKLEDVIRQACLDSIEPSIAPITERLLLPDSNGDEQAIVTVTIAPSLFVHRSPSGYLYRVGSAQRPMPPDFLSRLFQQRSQSRLIRFDETPVITASFSDLEPSFIKRFVPEYTEEITEVLLSKLGMAAQDHDQHWKPSVAGLLMACPYPEQFLPHAYIQAVAYDSVSVVPSAEGAYQKDALDIKGTLDQQIFAACHFIQKNMFVAARKAESGGRQDFPQYDMLSVFEAVVNAVAHRDYSMMGSKIRIRMFEDRLEIYTPGMLTNTMTTDSLMYRQAARNEVLTSLLARCHVQGDPLQAHRKHIMDKRGEGVPIILSRSLALSGTPPEYKMVDESELLLTIYAA